YYTQSPETSQPPETSRRREVGPLGRVPQRCLYDRTITLRTSAGRPRRVCGRHTPWRAARPSPSRFFSTALAAVVTALTDSSSFASGKLFRKRFFGLPFPAVSPTRCCGGPAHIPSCSACTLCLPQHAPPQASLSMKSLAPRASSSEHHRVTVMPRGQ